MNEMREPLRQFCEHEQLQEKTLSRAQISEVGSRQMTEWNEIQHQLALARQASQLGGGQRMSRLEVWRSQQQHLMDKSVHDSTAAPVTHFGSHSGPQVLLFLREDGTVGLGYCLSVYRGALISGTATRTLRVSRPMQCKPAASWTHQVAAYVGVGAVSGAHLDRHASESDPHD